MLRINDNLFEPEADENGQSYLFSGLADLAGYNPALAAMQQSEDRDDRRFVAFHRAHPEVYELFKQFAREMKAAGFDRYSARGLVHRIRWHVDVNQGKDGGFKLNDHFSTRYAKLLAAEDDDFSDFFEFREHARQSQNDQPPFRREDHP